MTDTSQYSQLVLHALQDTSVSHRALAMAQIAIIAPASGGVPDSADAPSLAVLNALYPGWVPVNGP